MEEKMTIERARRIRELRVDRNCTWRSVAEKTYHDWGKDTDWKPSSNQIIGIELCIIAAKMLGENAWREPWN